MGLTRSAVTIIGLQIPSDKIATECINYLNLCICTPQKISGNFCPECGRAVQRQYNRMKLNADTNIVERNGTLTIWNYPTVGNYYEDEYIYVGLIATATTPVYAAEMSEPVRVNLDINKLSIDTFKACMAAHNLWDKDRFGIWTIMLVQ